MEPFSRGVGRAAGKARQAGRAMPGHMPGSARSYHTPPIFNNIRTPNISSFTQRFASQAKSALTAFVGHLTAPGLRAGPSLASVRRIHVRPETIQDRMSLAARARVQAMRPMTNGGPFFPKAPAPAPRNITQVGLGSARNFSTTRPIFQNFVENVPVKGRAFCEADWKKKNASNKPGRPRANRGSKKAKAALKLENFPRQPTKVEETSEAEMNHYFPAEPVKPVTSYLLIPLAPTPSQRQPLPDDIEDGPSFLGRHMLALADIHRNHELHSLRVSTLFARLDAANVWNRGVNCSAYSLPAHRDDTSGVCSVLKVEFIGWTAAEVRAVLGESGSGWCSLHEVEHEKDLEEDDILSQSEFSVEDDGVGPTMGHPTDSLVLPRLDFSASSGLVTPSVFSEISSLSSPSLTDVDLSDSDMESVFSFSDLGRPSSSASQYF